MAAAARPYWTGFLKLSPVTIAVRLYSATTGLADKPRRSQQRRVGARKLPEISAGCVGSFRCAGSAREPGTYEHGPRGRAHEPVFMASGPGPRAVPE
jgi:hypothetical protein